MPPFHQADCDSSSHAVSSVPQDKSRIVAVSSENSHHGIRKSCLSTGTAAKQQQQEGRKVAFNEIEIREFAVGLGDNPSVFGGPPITLEWEPQKTHVLNLDAYEGAVGEGRRRGKELKMPSSIREGLLEGSYSKQEIKQASKAARRVRMQRNMSVAMVDIEHVEEFVQSAGRKIQRWRRRGNGGSLDPAEAWIQNYKNTSKLRMRPRKQH